jgi:ATP-dependent DNA ligase
LVRFCANLEEPKKFRWLSICGHLIVEAIKKLPVHIDGEAIVVDQTGLSVFYLLRCGQHDRAAVLCAFDSIELDGKDLRQRS